ncbi:serine/threonine protein kinase [Aestuariirhabdus sp. Z084]|uniref:serine/threonine protein kinase n=1 Tax=Aestuariirhabdus haliotis TaxID=2918751 RepID=UPI00201B37A2|nr:serine/threonine protein kinase [Aestuariirhabdus haliotis]MCL6414942.1 serine/threonine protein kinase [Aestuariirhabdus haliotis]MCL6418874.1 serine/threonine protein kinase [Aestuariirhabdus haliotis]
MQQPPTVNDSQLDQSSTQNAKPPYYALTPDTVIDAVESLGYLSDARVLALNSYENRVYQVGIEENTPIIAKFYRPQRWSDEQIAEEHNYLFELKELGLPVVPPLTLKGDNSVFEYKDYRFSLFPRQGGHAPELDNLDHLLVLGRMMGRIHLCGASTPFRHRPSIDIASYGEASVAFLLASEMIPAGLRTAYQTLCEDLLAQVRRIWGEVGQQPQIRLHGDCHIGNILWRDETPHFVDFDDSRNGPAIQDLWMFLSGDRNQQRLQCSELVEGYNEFNDFPAIQLRLIEPLRTLRLLHYNAWLGRRWEDPAFPHSFPWFNTERYWSEHILELREQLSALQEPPLELW